MSRWWWTVCVAVAVACSSAPGPGPNPTPGHEDAATPDASTPDASVKDGGCIYYGDPSAPAEVVPLLWQFDGGYAPLTTEGQPAPLWFAWQGGKVMLVGARIYNLEGCKVTLTARLRIPGDGGIAAEESRSVDFTVADEDGGIPELTYWNVANVPACPNYHGRAISGLPWTLEVIATDRQQKSATFSQLVTPSCDYDTEEQRYLCTCECAENYTLGSCTWPPADGGP